jgi:hypothetical protein
LLLKTREITGEEADAILFGESKRQLLEATTVLFVTTGRKVLDIYYYFCKGCVVKAVEVDLDVEFYLFFVKSVRIIEQALQAKQAGELGKRKSN